MQSQRYQTLIDYYRLAIKLEDSYSFDGVEYRWRWRTEWEIFKVTLDGVIDASATVRTPSITTWEDEFGHDMNEDNDFSGNTSSNLNDRTTDDERRNARRS